MEYLVILTILSAVAFSVCRSSKCPACLEKRADVEAVRMSAVKVQILSKLGLSAAPNVTGRRLPKIPPLMSMLESQMQSAQRRPSMEDGYHAKTQRMIVFPTRETQFLVGKSTSWWFFDFTRKKSRLKVTRAVLWIYMNNTTATEKKPQYFSLNIYQGVYPLDINNTPAKALILSRQFSGNESGWHNFKLKRVIKEWLQESHKNLGIYVELVGAAAGRIIFPGQDSNFQPFLVLHTQDSGDKRRAKRLAGVDCGDSRIPFSSSTCCRHPLTINFDLIGWEFVIAPKTYEAFYCTGECTGTGYSLHSYFHTHFVDKEKKRRGERNTFCCSPSKVSPITMLYLLNDRIMYEKVPGMVIETCGCS